MMGGYMGGALLPHLPDYQYFADDINEINRSIQKILALRADQFYVGHGGPLECARIEKRFGGK
jgi:glyoxylase-like metal-dependent hydrolase (beta-lactamase superfamily II)